MADGWIYRATSRWWSLLLLYWTSALTGAMSTTIEGKHLGCADGKCYRLYNQKITWEQARAICRENQTGQLAIIPDHRTQDTIHRVIGHSGIKQRVWVGGQNRGQTWRWLDGSVYEGERIDNLNGLLARCGYLYTGRTVRVGADHCENRKKYLCTSIFGSRENIGSTPRIWSEANTDCAARNKQLPIFSREEMQAVSDRLVHTYDRDEYWIGLCKAGWMWEGTEVPADFSYFHGKTPFCTPNNCLTIDYRGYWFNEDCFTRRGFLCEQQNLPYNPAGPVDVSGNGLTEGTTASDHDHGGHGHDFDHDHSDHHNEEEHNHGLLIGIILGLGVLITVLIVLLVLLISRRRAAEKRQQNKPNDADNIYSEIPDPVLPSRSNYYDVPEMQNGSNDSRELTTFKNKRLSSIPDYDGPACPTVPPPEQPPAQNGRPHGATNGESTGPYAVSYIACTPKNEKAAKSCTLDSVAKLPIAPTAPPIEGTIRKFPEETKREEDRYLLPKEKHPPVPARRFPKHNTSAHGHGRDKKGRKVDHEATSLMLEENDLYSDAGDFNNLRK